MTLTSALENLRSTTLQCVSGILQTLVYLSDIVHRERDAGHWGLERVYGRLAARRAVADAHHEAVSRVLTTPLQRLKVDVEESCRAESEAPQNYLERLRSRGSDLLPAAPGAGSARHLSSVLHALWCLSKARTPGATLPSASQHPRLARELPLAADISGLAPRPEKAGEAVR